MRKTSSERRLGVGEKLKTTPIRVPIGKSAILKELRRIGEFVGEGSSFCHKFSYASWHRGGNASENAGDDHREATVEWLYSHVV